LQLNTGLPSSILTHNITYIHMNTEYNIILYTHVFFISPPNAAINVQSIITSALNTSRCFSRATHFTDIIHTHHADDFLRTAGVITFRIIVLYAMSELSKAAVACSHGQKAGVTTVRQRVLHENMDLSDPG
jgi:hypothetical protein